MKNIIYLTFFLLGAYVQGQECELQSEIIKIILNDKSLNTFFKNKNVIIIGNSLCKDEILKTQIDRKDVTVKLTNGKTDIDQSISFLEYETTGKIIFAELSLYNKNVVHTIVLKKLLNDKITLVNQWTTFIKSKS
ncbi:hypothetical protein [Confluentibacter sediminis]|uniref:hypothetical protein n=1 Tax=Confluentibacter sediminis TaxID=2219045 RepID=UPI000DAEDDE0|nr:hypothetical protein [Confluentibacter sediminis]